MHRPLPCTLIATRCCEDEKDLGLRLQVLDCLSEEPTLCFHRNLEPEVTIDVTRRVPLVSIGERRYYLLQGQKFFPTLFQSLL